MRNARRVWCRSALRGLAHGASNNLQCTPNPDKLPLDALAADLTNHVIPSAIVTPGAVATLVELQQVGFHYAT